MWCSAGSPICSLLAKDYRRSSAAVFIPLNRSLSTVFAKVWLMPDSLHGSDKARLQTCNGPVSRVVVINDFSVARGGATMLVLLLLKLLREQNVDVTLIVGDDTHNADFDTLGIDVVRLGQQPLLKGNPLRTAINGINNTSAVNLISDWIAANDTTGTVYHVHIWSQILSPGSSCLWQKLLNARSSMHMTPSMPVRMGPTWITRRKSSAPGFLSPAPVL